MRRLRTKGAGTRIGESRRMGTLAGRCDTMEGIRLWIDRSGLPIGEVCGWDILHSHYRGRSSETATSRSLDPVETCRDGEDHGECVALFFHDR